MNIFKKRAAFVTLIYLLFFTLCAQAELTLNLDKSKLVACSFESSDELSLLNWIEKSDWLNVMSLRVPAKGDGKNDDTNAIQYALNQLSPDPGGYKAVYLPAGIYKITKTLHLENIEGTKLVGDGANTILKWDGARDKSMFWSDGVSRHSYLGIVFDGAGKASVGIDHASRSKYETRVIHEHLQFKNFTVAGIRVGYKQIVASAEMMFNNLLFNNNKVGLLLLSANDYNNTIDGCHFEDNEISISAARGNIVVRNSRFERSRNTDLLLGAHSHSVRRSISVDSNSFIHVPRGPAASAPITIQDVYVKSWKNKKGAIISGLRGPVIIFDSTFVNPPDNTTPILYFDHPSYMNQIGLVYNTSCDNCRKLYHIDRNSEIVNLGKTNNTGSSLSGAERFLMNRVVSQKIVIDVKKDCGVTNNGFIEDTVRIQNCIDRHQKSSWNTELYFPSGTYIIRDTLKLVNSSFKFSGSGWHSQIILKGDSGNTLEIQNPQGLIIEGLAIGGSDRITKIAQTGLVSGYVHYKNVYAYHDDENRRNGFLLENLPENTYVIGSHVDGTFRIKDSENANILMSNLMSVNLSISQSSASPRGILGILNFVSCCSKFPLELNQVKNITITDWYNEQSEHLLKINGSKKFKSRITLSHTEANFENIKSSVLNNYYGDLIQFGGNHGQAGVKNSRKFEVNNAGNPNIFMVGNMVWHNKPSATDINVNLKGFANVIDDFDNAPYTFYNDKMSEKSKQHIVAALHDFRTLGAYDRKLNYCQ